MVKLEDALLLTGGMGFFGTVLAHQATIGYPEFIQTNTLIGGVVGLLAGALLSKYL